MTHRFMLDTNTASHIIKGTTQAIKNHLSSVPMGNICISVITETELLYGLAKKPDATALHKTVQSFLLYVDVLPWDSQAAFSYGKLRYRIESNGTPLGNLDLMIAAHAMARECILVTDDRTFYNVKPALKLANWTLSH